MEPVLRLPGPARFWLRLLALGDGQFGIAARAARELGVGIADLAPAERQGSSG
jgi:hypothetical protein